MDTTKILKQHVDDKNTSVKFKERRHKKWLEINQMYRDVVPTNRLVQRQPINVPIIRDTLQSWLSKIDEDPQLTFETRGAGNRDRDGEILLNELWKYTYDDQKLDLVDNLDKKTVGLMGRSFKYWYMHGRQVKCTVIDPLDIDIDPTVSPFDINSAQFFNHKHIFVPLRVILANRSYSHEGKVMLKAYLDTKGGLLAANQANEDAQARRARLETLGVTNYDQMGAADVMVELNRCYRNIWVESERRFVRHMIITAMDKAVLYMKPIKAAIGIDFLPYSTWASDPDASDFWSDGISDNILTMNKLVNIYMSQDVETRAYANFGMYFYNTAGGTFSPKTFIAKPFGMYGVPGKPEDYIKRMDIQPLSDSAATIEWIKTLIQSSVAQTPTERGVQDRRKSTLGEIELTLQQSQTRQQVVAKQYRTSWEESGRIFYGLLANNPLGKLTLFKKAPNGDYMKKDVRSTDFVQPEGYEVKVVLRSEREQNDDTELKKNNYIKKVFANNPVAQKLAKRKDLELLGWSQADIDAVLQYEEQQMAPRPELPPDAAGGGAPADPAVPDPTQMVDEQAMA